MVSPGLQPPQPPENPHGLPVYRPQGLTLHFPQGWVIKFQVCDGTWSAERGATMRLVIEAERLEAQCFLARL